MEKNVRLESELLLSRVKIGAEGSGTGFWK